MIAEQGFAGFGVNALALRSGVDKVLIYRYFDGIDGVLARLADEVVLMPPVEAMLDGSVCGFLVNLRNWLSGQPLSVQLWQWEALEDNALTRAWNASQAAFWREVERCLCPQDPPSREFMRILPMMPLHRTDMSGLDDILAAFSFAPLAVKATPYGSDNVPYDPALVGMQEALPTELL